MKITSYIFIAFFFIIAMFSVTTVLNFRLSSAVSKEAEFVNTSTEIIRNSNRFQRNIIDMVSGLRGYLLTGEKYFVESYDSAYAENESILSELAPLILDSSQKRLLSEIQTLNDSWTEEFAEPLRQAKQMAVDSAQNLAVFNNVYREKFLTGDEQRIQLELRNKFKAFSNKEYSIRDRRKRELTETAEQAKNISLVLVVVSVVTALIIVSVLVKRVSNRIGTMVKMANNIAKGNYDVAAGSRNYKDELTDLERSLDEMANELSKHIGLLKNKNLELDQYAHIVSHDLKGPLRGISNVVAWMEEDHTDELSDKAKEYLELIKKRIHRAEYLIEGILDYARTDREKMPVEFVDIEQMLGEVVETIAPRPGIKISINTSLPTIITEKIALFQIFINLIGNAVKYHDKSTGTVNIYHREHTDYYEFFVEDDGPGIEEQYFEKIFIAFQTLHERDSFESSGVGLAIVKKILDSREEAIVVKSKINAGTIFSFTWSKQKSV